MANEMQGLRLTITTSLEGDEVALRFLSSKSNADEDGKNHLSSLCLGSPTLKC